MPRMAGSTLRKIRSTKLGRMAVTTALSTGTLANQVVTLFSASSDYGRVIRRISCQSHSHLKTRVN